MSTRINFDAATAAGMQSNVFETVVDASRAPHSTVGAYQLADQLSSFRPKNPPGTGQRRRPGAGAAQKAVGSSVGGVNTEQREGQAPASHTAHTGLEGPEGWLYKESGGKQNFGGLWQKKNWKKRWFVLTHDTLRYFVKADMDDHKGSIHMYEVDHVAALAQSDAVIDRNLDDLDHNSKEDLHFFSIVTGRSCFLAPTSRTEPLRVLSSCLTTMTCVAPGGRTWVLASLSESERDAWVASIQRQRDNAAHALQAQVLAPPSPSCEPRPCPCCLSPIPQSLILSLSQRSSLLVHGFASTHVPHTHAFMGSTVTRGGGRESPWECKRGLPGRTLGAATRQGHGQQLTWISQTCRRQLGDPAQPVKPNGASRRSPRPVGRLAAASVR